MTSESCNDRYSMLVVRACVVWPCWERWHGTQSPLLANSLAVNNPLKSGLTTMLVQRPFIVGMTLARGGRFRPR